MLGDTIEVKKRRELAWKLILREEKKMGFKTKMTKEEAVEHTEWLAKTRDKYQKYTIEELEEMLNANPLDNYKEINANVAAHLEKELENGLISLNETLNLIRNARVTLDKNQLVIDGLTKTDYDKDTAIKQLSEAISLFNKAKYEVSCAIDSLRMADDLKLDA